MGYLLCRCSSGEVILSSFVFVAHASAKWWTLLRVSSSNDGSRSIIDGLMHKKNTLQYSIFGSEFTLHVSDDEEDEVREESSRWATLSPPRPSAQTKVHQLMTGVYSGERAGNAGRGGSDRVAAPSPQDYRSGGLRFQLGGGGRGYDEWRDRRVASTSTAPAFASVGTVWGDDKIAGALGSARAMSVSSTCRARTEKVDAHKVCHGVCVLVV